MTNETMAPQGTLEGNKQAFVKDMKSVVADADAVLSNIAQSAVDEFSLARGKLDANLAQAKSRLIDAGAAVSDRARFAADSTDLYVRDNPWKMLGFAAAAGVVIGAILSRR